MHRTIPLVGALALAASLFAPAEEPPLPSREPPKAEDPANAATPAPPPPIIGTQQINRYGAIAELQGALKADPNSLADWVILGELAHEVAIDAPPDRAAKYLTMSREAYEKALALAPNNVGLKAAVQFAKDQEAHGTAFEAARDQATRAYLDARRRDLAATRYTPTVRVYSPVTAIQPAAVTAATETVSTDPFGVRQFYPAPIYQPYYMPQERLYTYDEYRDAYYPPSYYTVPNGQPIGPGTK